MAKTSQPAAEAGSNARYDVRINARFNFMGFDYMPGHHHVVDQTIYDAMNAAGVVVDVKQLS